MCPSPIRSHSPCDMLRPLDTLRLLPTHIDYHLLLLLLLLILEVCCAPKTRSRYTITPIPDTIYLILGVVSALATEIIVLPPGGVHSGQHPLVHHQLHRVCCHLLAANIHHRGRSQLLPLSIAVVPPPQRDGGVCGEWSVGRGDHRPSAQRRQSEHG